MSGEGLHIPVDADDAQLRKLAAALRTTKKEALEATKAIKGLGAAAGNSGGGNGAHHPPTGGGGHHGMLHRLARLTRGTEFGHLAHAGAAAQSFGGGSVGMLAMGGAVAGVTVAFGLLKAASERAMEAAKREFEIRTEMTHAIRDSIKAADSKAVGAFTSHKDALLSLAGVGGDAAVQSALKFGGEAGPGGIKAYSAIAGMHGGFKESNLEGAKAAASTGQISIDKAAEMISSGKVRGGLDPFTQAAAILSQSTGQRISASDVAEMAANVKGSKLGSAAEGFEAREGGIVAAGVNRLQTSGSIAAGQNKELGEIKDPLTAAQVEVGKKLDETHRHLQVLADSQWRIVKWIEHGASAYGLGSGSAQDAADREKDAQNHATSAP